MKGRRGNGEGGIYFEESRGRYVGQLDLGADSAGRRQRRKVTGRTRTDVANKLKALREQGARARVNTDCRTVAQLLERWLETSAAARLGSGTTLDNYRAQIDQHISPALGRRRLDQLSAEHIDDYLLGKAREGYSRATLVRHRSILGQALRWGVKRRHISWDPASLAEMPTAEVFAAAKPKQVRTPRALTADEARKFLAAAEGRRNSASLALIHRSASWCEVRASAESASRTGRMTVFYLVIPLVPEGTFCEHSFAQHRPDRRAFR